MARRLFTTMKDVARAAEVSISTVSHVVGKTRFVKRATRQKVLKAMADLKYQPDMVAQSLRRKTTHTIGLIFCDLVNPIFAEIVKRIEKRLIGKGYSSILTDTDYNIDKEKEMVTLLCAKRVDGFIIVPAGGDDKHIESLIEQGMPVVLIDHKMDKLRTDTVLLKHEKGIEQLTEHLIRLGHKRIGIITGPLNCFTGKERLAGYLEALKQHGLVKNDELVKVGDYKEQSGHSLTLELLSLSSPPTAILACNNLMGLGAMNALHDKGIRIPDEMGLVIFGDLPWFRYTDPPLTVTAYRTSDIGEMAGQLLLERIRRRRKKPRQVVLDVELIQRGSAGEYKKGKSGKVIRDTLSP
ncbi:LacI family transcriptional regulator [Candidatus Aerophobetes bacterium]|uniref:LacI family transcriptional regulator n=1 Tax=Aerophobetes bacterium TaxID=2030807 RepID=A0A523WCL3_UNCAE|nr:MAG: LacI family transcriptional regulator [Candidatus Aerophobetes bacterium]